MQHMINKHMKLMNIHILIGFLHEYVTVKHEASAHGNTPYIIYHGDSISGEKKNRNYIYMVCASVIIMRFFLTLGTFAMVRI